MDIINNTIVVIGCFDTKGTDFSYLIECIQLNGCKPLTINTGVMKTSVDFDIDISQTQVAEAAGTDLLSIRDANDRGKAVELMGKGAARILEDLVHQGKISGVIGMGGGGNTYITLEAMQSVPMGIPKFCLSTLAAQDLTRQIGIKDVTLMVSSVDIAGLNSISKLLMQQAAAAVCAMSQVSLDTTGDSGKRIAISMFGNTTKCVDYCTGILKDEGYEVLVFHATGIGGATMESLIQEGVFVGVLDVTTTELADELCGGILSAGPDRLTAASNRGVPQVVVPGCLDMVNFAHIDAVPEKYQSRHLYSWSPDVTLMRTDLEENKKLGEILAQKLNNASGPAEILIPLKGISQLDTKGDIFYQPDIDAALFSSIRENATSDVPVTEVDAHINEESFARHLTTHLLKLIEEKR